MSKKLKNIVRVALTALFLFVMAGTASAQQTIKGTVVDGTGEPIIGATVKEPNSANGAVTDIDGNFTLTTNSKTVEVSYVGMKTQTINIQGKSTINVKLEDDSQGLNEVVVVGYGTMRRKDLTGSVATVNSEALQAVPVANATEALTGKMAGVQITTTEGSPDAEMKIRVRGGGSITGDNTPLFIVDGFPVESIGDIPASDIEDITVLKDASSTAIYGSRGANGVILVTTKSGQAGKIKVSYNAFYSWKKMAKKLHTLSASDYIDWQYERALLRDNDDYESLFGSYEDRDLYANLPTNNWQNEVFGRTGHTFNHNISITGGSDATKFSFNYAHINDKAIMIGSSFKRDNLSLKLNHQINKKMKLDFSARYSNQTVWGAGANESKSEVSSADSRLKNVMIYPMFNFSDLSDSYDPEFSLVQPITSVRDADRRQTRQTYNFNGSFQWEIFKNFKFKTEFGLDRYYNTDFRYYGVTTYFARERGNGLPMGTFTDKTRNAFRNTNTVNYDFKDIFGKDSNHSLSVLLGEETINLKSDINTYTTYQYPSDFTAKQVRTLTSQGLAYGNPSRYVYADDNLLSFFARANYSYMDKYLVSATFRADGSSKFASGNRWGYFPSAAVAWRISSESFMDNTKSWLDDLKLRLSYGTAGNNNIPADQTAPIWAAGLNSAAYNWMFFDNYWQVGEYLDGTNVQYQAYNRDLTWETTYTRNIGLDFTLFRSKLNGSIEYYWNTTKDLLINFPVSGTGYSFQYRNLGKTENQGVELSLTYHAINTKDFGLDFTGNIGFNKNKVKSLGGLDSYSASSGWASTLISGDYRVQVGRAVGEIYGYRSDGRYSASDFTWDGSNWIPNDGVVSDASVIGTSYFRPGAMKLKDISGPDGEPDGVVDAYDQCIIGNTNPKASGGFSINARAYGFDLAANFTYSIGNDVYNANKIEYTSSYQYKYRNMLDIMAAGKRWTNLDPETNMLCTDPVRLDEINANTTMWSPYTGFVLTDWAVEDGSFLRLSTLTLGYTLPQNITNRVGISSLRFYGTIYNVFCITGYSGFDPEVSTRNKTALTPGVDYSAYPKSRQFVIGLNLNF